MDRRSQIIEAAIDLILRDGVVVSTAKIAKAAGVSNGTLFNAFPTKQALIDAVYLTAKSDMYLALAHAPGEPFDRAALRRKWRGYLAWARERPEHRHVMHRLAESGLASPAAQGQVQALAMPLAIWLGDAFDKSLIRGPNVMYVSKLILLTLDLAITQNLHGAAEEAAFDMLCNALGVES